MLYKLFYQTLSAVVVSTFLSGCSVRPLYEDAVSGGDERAASITVDIIANRDGQKLRLYLQQALRDIQFTNKKMRLTVTLTLTNKTFALDTDGYAKRLLSTYEANIVLKDDEGRKIIDKNISSSVTYNIAQTQGEVMLSLYGRNNSAFLKEIARRIVESIRMALEDEAK